MNHGDIRLNEHRQPDHVPVEAVVAGTLCLMSCTMQSGSMLYLQKIVDNLCLLSESGNVSEEMRRVCRKLALHWQSALDAEPQAAGMPAVAADDTAALH